jgi:hypothetical protein
MTISHNKRRNSGLMYEFLIKTIAQSLVEGDQKKSSTALKILKKYYKKGTQLYKELRLINALVRTTVSSENVATSILSEAKKASQNYNVEKLDKEKSYLIRQVNHFLSDESFYSQHIDTYKMYATAQSLINQWRLPDSKKSISETAEYEDRLTKWLISEKPENSSEITMEDISSGTSNLLVNVMTKKINDKYSSSLSHEQRDILKEYAFSNISNDKNSLIQKLNQKKSETITAIDKYLSEDNSENVFISEKLLKAKESILKEDLERVSDKLITKFMLYINLKNEINEREG